MLEELQSLRYFNNSQQLTVDTFIHLIVHTFIHKYIQGFQKYLLKLYFLVGVSYKQTGRCHVP